MRLYSLTLPFPIILYASLLIVIGTYQFDQKNVRHVECLDYFIVSLVLGGFIGFILKMISYFLCDKNLSVLTRNQRDILIGNVGMVVFGFVFLWGTYRHGMDRPALIFSSIATNLLSVLFWILFIFPTREKLIRLSDHKKYRKTQQIGVTIYFLILILVLSLVTNRDIKNLDRRMLLLHLLFFFCSYGISLIDILVIWTGGVVLSAKGLELEARKNISQLPRKPLDEPDDKKVSEELESTLDSLECEICGHGYSHSRLPLIIKVCGHTVCENCIATLQEKSDWNCPSCRQFSNVQVTDLPVNRTILDYISDRDRFDALACIQCNFRFNEDRVPLVLRECGHSICQNCITTLGKNGFTVCMACRKITFLSDIKTGQQLPKNYAVLSVIREL